jgi:hypothetical protein
MCRFKNMEVLVAYQNGPALATFNNEAARFELLAEPVVVKVIKGVSGYTV